MYWWVYLPHSRKLLETLQVKPKSHWNLPAWLRKLRPLRGTRGFVWRCFALVMSGSVLLKGFKMPCSCVRQLVNSTTLTLLYLMIHGLNPWNMQRTNFTWNCPSPGLPRTALYKHYAQADVTWLGLLYRIRHGRLNQDPAHPCLDSPKRRQLWQLWQTHHELEFWAGSSAGLRTMTLPAFWGSIILFYRLVWIVLVDSTQSWPLPTWIKMLNTEKINGLMPKFTCLVGVLAPGFPPSPPWSPGESSPQNDEILFQYVDVM